MQIDNGTRAQTEVPATLTSKVLQYLLRVDMMRLARNSDILRFSYHVIHFEKNEQVFQDLRSACFCFWSDTVLFFI